MNMGQDGAASISGIGDGTDNIALAQHPAGSDAIIWPDMTVYCVQISSPAITGTMPDEHGFSQKIITDFYDFAFKTNRYQGLFAEVPDIPFSRPVQANVQAFMGPVTLSPVTPPFVKRAKQHGRMESHLLESEPVKAVAAS